MLCLISIFTCTLSNATKLGQSKLLFLAEIINFNNKRKSIIAMYTDEFLHRSHKDVLIQIVKTLSKDYEQKLEMLKKSMYETYKNIKSGQVCYFHKCAIDGCNEFVIDRGYIDDTDKRNYIYSTLLIDHLQNKDKNIDKVKDKNIVGFVCWFCSGYYCGKHHRGELTVRKTCRECYPTAKEQSPWLPDIPVYSNNEKDESLKNNNKRERE